MSTKAPTPRFTVITLGVTEMRASIAFYEALGFARKMHATGEAVAFFETGGTVIALFPWDQLARDATLPGYFGDPDNHPWEVVVAPGIEVGDDRRVHLSD
jgi:uncharacterized protein